VLHPAERMFEAMLDGWRSQQLARGLGFGTIEARERAVRRFHAHSNDWPWAWSAQHVEEWCADLRVVHRVSLHRLLVPACTGPCRDGSARCWCSRALCGAPVLGLPSAHRAPLVDIAMSTSASAEAFSRLILKEC